MADANGIPDRQEAAEADVERYRKDLGPFVVAAETTRMPMVFTNAQASNNPIVFVNQSFLDLTGYEEHEVLGQDFDFLIEDDTDPEALTQIQTAFEGGRGLETQVRFRCKNGKDLWVAIFISTVWDKDGHVVQHFASFVDVGQHWRDENRLERLLRSTSESMQDRLTSIMDLAETTLRGAVANETLDAFLHQVSALSKSDKAPH